MVIKTALEAFIKGARGEKLEGSLPTRSARDAWRAGQRVSAFFGDGPLTDECLTSVFNEWTSVVEECDAMLYRLDTASECERYYGLLGLAHGLSIIYAESVPVLFVSTYLTGRDAGFRKVRSIVDEHRDG